MKTTVPISSCFAAPTVTMGDIVTFPVSEASSLLKWSTVSSVSPVPRWKEQLVRGSRWASKPKLNNVDLGWCSIYYFERSANFLLKSSPTSFHWCCAQDHHIKEGLQLTPPNEWGKERCSALLSETDSHWKTARWLEVSNGEDEWGGRASDTMGARRLTSLASICHQPQGRRLRSPFWSLKNVFRRQLYKWEKQNLPWIENTVC